MGGGGRGLRVEGIEGGMHERKKKMEGKYGGFVVCSQAEGTVCGAWRWALRTPGLSLLSGPGKHTHTHTN